jgi:hypothetical protein
LAEQDEDLQIIAWLSVTGSGVLGISGGAFTGTGSDAADSCRNRERDEGRGAAK